MLGVILSFEIFLKSWLTNVNGVFLRVTPLGVRLAREISFRFIAFANFLFHIRLHAKHRGGINQRLAHKGHYRIAEHAHRRHRKRGNV